jgi:hypothetical protein
MSEESKITPKEQATIDVVVNMSEPLSDRAKMSLMEDIFNTLDKDSMVDFTDFCNSRMQDVITHKAEIAGRMVGKKAGELFQDAKNLTAWQINLVKKWGKTVETEKTGAT